jgi:hypothetical protein
MKTCPRCQKRNLETVSTCCMCDHALSTTAPESGVRSSALVSLRWLVVERGHTNWCDRADDFVTRIYENPPVLQYSTDGEKTWSEVPTVRLKYEKANSVLNKPEAE